MFRSVVVASFYALFVVVFEHLVLPLVLRIAFFCSCRLEISCAGFVCLCLLLLFACWAAFCIVVRARRFASARDVLFHMCVLFLFDL